MVLDNNEEIRPVIIDGVEMKGYYVTNTGRVFSALVNSPTLVDGRIVSNKKVISETKKELKVYPKSKTVPYLCVNIYYRENDIDYDYKFKQKAILVHQLVMTAFKPISEYPPKRLENYWKDTPEDIKKWIAESVFINHIDHDPTNNHIDNLEYVTPRENSRKAIKHYGCFNTESANKKKIVQKLMVPPNLPPEKNLLSFF
jgi:hypothetical protein